MSRRAARLAVAVLFALACGAAAWQYLRVERALTSETVTAASFDRDARALSTSIADLRAAQQAYVAAGQGTDYWTARVGALVGSLRSRVASLRDHAVSAEAATRLDDARTAIDDFARMDQRAREYASAEQRLLASDLIFADGFEMTQGIASEIETARSEEGVRRAETADRFRRQQQMLAGGVAGIGLLFMLILAFAPGPRRAAIDESAVSESLAEEPLARADHGLGLALDEPARTAPVIDLGRAADLCLDFARVADTHQIPALLERAARVLDASGIVLWIADPEGRELIPTVAHGYSPAAIARVGAIQRNDDNATAAAFREGKVHTVKGDVLTSGAIVAPLVTPAGCVGVMAAEVRHEREQHQDVRAVAAILAAQLATIVGAAPASHARAKAN